MKTSHIELKAEKEEINLIQITDSHLFKSKQEKLRGVNTFEKLKIVLEDIKNNSNSIDGILVTGDISEDRSTESYQIFHDELSQLKLPSLWLQGNHDNFKNLPEPLVNQHVFNTATLGQWKLIFLDTTISGVDHGNMDTSELYRLDSFLKENHSSPSLVCMHHPPIDVGSNFIDRLGLNNKSDFWEIINSNITPKAVLFGHVHQPIDTTINGVRLLSPPATSMQWIPRSDDFAFTPEGQGYQLIQLKATGDILISPKTVS